MGFLGKMFGGKTDYPHLSADSPIAEQLHDVEEPLKTLMSQVTDRMEVVPAEDRTYVFIGKPPKRFGVVWIENGEVVNFQSLAKEKGLDAQEMQRLSDMLQEAYEHNESAERFSTNLAGRDVVVTHSAELKKEVSQIIGNMMN